MQIRKIQIRKNPMQRRVKKLTVQRLAKLTVAQTILRVPISSTVPCLREVPLQLRRRMRPNTGLMPLRI
jgi:hypothetical protein